MSFYSYPKIPTVYERDMEGTKLLRIGVYSSPTLEVLSNIEWVSTEKFDGTNVGIVWDGHDITFQGRTEKSAFSAVQYKFLEDTFKNEETEQIFEQMFEDRPVVLFGELVGKGIQKAGQFYCSDGLRFIPFDLLLAEQGDKPEIWANHGVFGLFCAGLNLHPAPEVFSGSLFDAVAHVNNLPSSSLGPVVMEGLVMRPKVELRDNQGKRVICKIKAEDFKDKGVIKDANLKYQEAQA